MNDPASLPSAERFALIMKLMCEAVGSRGPARGIGRVPIPLLQLIVTYLRRLVARFTHYATIPQPPPRARRPTKRPPRRPNPLALPRGKFWLMILIPETAGAASQLQHFLMQPDVQALLAADPRLRRMLRPLCRMLKLRVDPETFHPLSYNPVPPRRSKTPPPPLPIPLVPPSPILAQALLARWLARAKLPESALPRLSHPPPFKPA